MNPVLSDQKQDVVADLNKLGPGDRLRNARLALDIDIASLAKRLHLTTDVVEALERDDYSEMTARVFVRGYLRNYAREVNLPEDSVLEQFSQICPESERPMKITTPPRLASDTHPGNRWTTILTWLVVLSGIALFLIWWQGYLDDFLQQQSREPEQTTNTTTSSTDTPENVSTLPAFMQPVQSSVGASTDSAEGRETQTGIAQPNQPTKTENGVAVNTDNPSSESTVAVNRLADNIVSNVTSDGVRQITIDGSNADNAQSSAAEEVVLELSPAPQPAVTTTPENNPPEQTTQTNPALEPDAVTISFSGLCWVDIRDSTRSYKLVGEMNQGDSHKLEGTPPYKVIIGNARAAQIRVGGKLYDLAQHTSGNVARLTLQP